VKVDNQERLVRLLEEAETETLHARELANEGTTLDSCLEASRRLADALFNVVSSLRDLARDQQR
jgi:hypothetical protein